MDHKVLAIIPARGGSKGIPRKNLKQIGGKSLLVHAIEQASASRYINRVLVSSEDAEIQTVAKDAGADVLERPEEFIHDNRVQDVDRLLIWTLNHLASEGYSADLVVLLYPTAPLRRVATIDEAIEKVLIDNYDSVLSVYEDTTYLWAIDEDIIKPTNYDPKQRKPRQQENWNQWAENKAVYVVKADLLIKNGCRIVGRVGWVEMPFIESIDVDTPDDLKLCEQLLENRNK